MQIDNVDAVRGIWVMDRIKIRLNSVTCLFRLSFRCQRAFSDRVVHEANRAGFKIFYYADAAGFLLSWAVDQSISMIPSEVARACLVPIARGRTYISWIASLHASSCFQRAIEYSTVQLSHGRRCRASAGPADHHQCTKERAASLLSNQTCCQCGRVH